MAQLLWSLLFLIINIAAEGLQFLRLGMSSRARLSAEILFLRKQLAFFQEHQIMPQKLNGAARFSLLLWSRLFNWREALVIVKPETLIGWQRKGFKLAMEVTGRKTTPTRENSQVDCSDDRAEPDLGRRARGRGTFGEARDLGFTTHDPSLLAAGA